MTNYQLQIINYKFVLFVSFVCISILVSHYLFFRFANAQDSVPIEGDTPSLFEQPKPPPPPAPPPAPKLPTGSGGQTPSGGTGSGGQAPGGSAGGSQSITIPNPLGARTFEELISRIIRWLLVIGAPILTLFIIIGAFQILTAGGNSEKVTKGRHTITSAIIGYALLLLSTGIIEIIKRVLGAR